jgi:hypothetical protein|tara:strand:- start:82 stop:369 length:288 start_codon:yes stop_codon:yes gene_type:complete
MAHIQLAVISEADTAQGHDGHRDAHDQDPHDRDAPTHHEHTGPTSDHGAELHFTALGASPSTEVLPFPDGPVRSTFADLQYPAPLLPPDPDPDRA